MKKLYKLAFFIFSLFLLSKTQASHMAGGDIRYTYLGSDKYLIIATLYRDCRGVELNSPQIGAYGGVNGSNGCFNTSLAATRISITDVTPRCSTSGKPCNPQNVYGTGEGFEEHVYTCTVDISKTPFAENIGKSSCCEITFYCKLNSRPGLITTGPAGSTFAIRLTINFCNLKKCASKTSSSPRFLYPTTGFGCCNQTVYKQLGGWDPDGDLTKYALTPALYDLPNTSVNYASPFTYQYPVTCYCVPPTTIKCTPNLTTEPPRGFYLDTNSGALVFTSTKCDEGSVIAVNATEFRKDTSGNYVWIASTIRDFLMVIKDDCDYNLVPKTDPMYALYIVKEGDTLRTDFDVRDKTFSPYQTIPDTPGIISWDSFSSQKLTLMTPGAREKTYRLEWPIKKGEAKGFDDYVRIKISDNHCPQPLLSEHNLRIRIQKKGTSLDFTQTAEACGGLRLEAVTKPNDVATFMWEIIDTSTGITVTTANAKSWVPTANLKGSYKVLLSARDGFYFYDDLEKYVNFPDDRFHAFIGNDTALCQGNSLVIQPEIFNAVLPVKYLWRVLENNVVKHTDSGFSLTLSNLQKTQKVQLTITDSIGCVYSTPSRVIQVFPLPLHNLGTDVTLCSKSSHVLGYNADTLIRYLWNTGQTTSSITATQSGMYWLTETSQNGCSFSDTIAIKLVPKPEVETQTNINICRPLSNDLEIDLNQYLKFNSGAVPNDTVQYVSMTFNQFTNPIVNKHYIKVNKTINTGNWNVNFVVPMAGCPSLSGTFPISINPTPEAKFSITPSHMNIFDQFDIKFTNLSSISDNSKMRFTWNFDRFPDDTANFATDTTIIYPQTSAGYQPQLIAHSSKGCRDTTDKLMNIFVGVDDLNVHKVKISPDLVVLNKDINDVNLKLFDGTGRLVTEIKNNLGLTANGANNPPPGVYFYALEIISNSGEYQILRGKVLLPVQP